MAACQHLPANSWEKVNREFPWYSHLTIIHLGEYSPIFTSPEANNCFSIITQVIIREKQEPFEKCRFCLFVSNCYASMNRDAQFVDHMINRNHKLNR